MVGRRRTDAAVSFLALLAVLSALLAVVCGR